MLQLKSEELVGADSCIKVLNRRPQADYPEHCHDFSELVLISSGSGLHMINGKQTVILPNTIACVSDKDYHQYADNRDVVLVNILYNKDQLDLGPKAVDVIKNLENRATNLLITEEHFTPLMALAENIYQEQHTHEAHSRCMQSLMFEQLILMIDRLNISHIDNSPMMRAIVYLSNNYKDQELSVHQICDEFKVTPRALNKKISQLTGLSTNKFLNQLRIKKAIRLIESGQPITDVAYYVGYNDSNYFSTKFKGLTGKTPREYRLSALKEY